ncbi:MAG: M23 family metallopeptidase, partial [Candidatus Delongbacteria bacterium]
MINFASIVEAQPRPAFLDDSTTYFWPTNASRYMSSSFGESRSSHFHAAIDIGTWGHEGHAVFAARDGLVYRVAVGPVGYGNVIYMRHDDGSASVYAHLKDFHPEIRSIVDSLRLKNYSFEFDRNMEEYDIRFSRGQQIGWTGSTGVGPPHLHFELRTPEGRPFNPLLAGVYIDDTIPPQFSALAIEPLASDSKIKGGTAIHRTLPTRHGGQYHFGTVDVQGEIGLAVDVFDRANASNNVHAVYELEMV